MNHQSLTEDKLGIALIIEFLGGIFGFLGMGYYYAGYRDEANQRFMFWLFFLAVAWPPSCIAGALSFGFCLLPILLIQFFIPIFSAISLQNRARRGPAVPNGFDPFVILRNAEADKLILRAEIAYKAGNVDGAIELLKAANNPRAEAILVEINKIHNSTNTGLLN